MKTMFRIVRYLGRYLIVDLVLTKKREMNSTRLM